MFFSRVKTDFFEGPPAFEDEVYAGGGVAAGAAGAGGGTVSPPPPLTGSFADVSDVSVVQLFFFVTHFKAI